jgi:hypothetical protein
MVVNSEISNTQHLGVSNKNGKHLVGTTDFM